MTFTAELGISDSKPGNIVPGWDLAISEAEFLMSITLTNYRNALFTILETQRTATPTLLRKNYRYRPGTVSETPCAWVGTIQESMVIDAGTRSRESMAEVIIAAPFPSDLITDDDPFDELYAALIDRFTLLANVTVLNNSVLELTAIAQDELTLQGAEKSNTYRAMTLTTRLRIWEGRD